jgi:hypothetical protein
MKIGGTFPLLGSFSILIRLPLTISMEFVTEGLFSWALFRFQSLPPKFTMQNSYFPSHQNAGTYMEY